MQKKYRIYDDNSFVSTNTQSALPRLPSSTEHEEVNSLNESRTVEASNESCNTFSKLLQRLEKFRVDLNDSTNSSWGACSLQNVHTTQPNKAEKNILTTSEQQQQQIAADSNVHFRSNAVNTAKKAKAKQKLLQNRLQIVSDRGSKERDKKKSITPKEQFKKENPIFCLFVFFLLMERYMCLLLCKKWDSKQYTSAEQLVSEQFYGGEFAVHETDMYSRVNPRSCGRSVDKK
ncbi:hypothetical protein RFI_00577 [Reticulomyxa filosa]|uniref:Uncharacterized protein n=1 Tax=Reticulomyxa filosa TaxID=46433 RepID=X6PDC7_RETFI|nr:hypothetical protein RFI_00577 [Reticulomyxa filosa]|eukprot:ETO36485.1 hypothetical protein RFI_00577 [Reticulomyxa filosa]